MCDGTLSNTFSTFFHQWKENLISNETTTCLRYGGIHNGFCWNLVLFPAVKEFGELVKIWQSLAASFLSVCSVLHSTK